MQFKIIQILSYVPQKVTYNKHRKNKQQKEK